MEPLTYMSEFHPSSRLLMGAGPSNFDPRVLEAMAAPMLGHLDPDFLKVMDDVRIMLREVFLTDNTLTLPVSGTGTAGMEAAVVNVVEPGDTIVVGANGYFADRLADIAQRAGATVHKVVQPYGEPVDANALEAEVKRHPDVKAVAMVHAETSAGVVTPVPEIAGIAHNADALLIVDAVTSLGGVELRIDDWDVDICYSGTQKCLACPPGLSPITMSDRAMDIIESRKTPVQSFYLDLSKLRQYWQQRAYHHTAPIIMIYALREALRLLLEEGLEARWARHALNADAMRAGLEAMGLGLFGREGYRLPSLVAAVIPEGIDDAAARKMLLEKHDTEISGGLGEQAGRIWRVGLMGHNSTPRNVLFLLSALEDVLLSQGYEVALGASLSAAQKVLHQR